jgi:hypothetical protein
LFCIAIGIASLKFFEKRLNCLAHYFPFPRLESPRPRTPEPPTSARMPPRRIATSLQRVHTFEYFFSRRTVNPLRTHRAPFRLILI